jgi:hypothetical protein
MVDEETVKNYDNEGGGGGSGSSSRRLSRREIFEAAFSGARGHYKQWVPLLRSDPPWSRYGWRVQSLEEFRAQEGAEREERLRAIWGRLLLLRGGDSGSGGDRQWMKMRRGEDKDKLRGGGCDGSSFTWESASKLQEIYEIELIGRCRGGRSGAQGGATPISWKEFCGYVEAKETGACFFFANAVLNMNDSFFFVLKFLFVRVVAYIS